MRTTFDSPPFPLQMKQALARHALQIISLALRKSELSQGLNRVVKLCAMYVLDNSSQLLQSLLA